MANRSARKRLAACLGISCLAVGGAPELVARFEDWQVGCALRALPGVSVAAVTHEAISGRTLFSDLSLTRDAVRIDIGRLSLGRRPPGPSLVGQAAAGPADGMAAAARAAGAAVGGTPAKPAVAPDASATVADDIRVLANGHLYRISHIELRGTRLGAAELADLLDTARPMPLADRLSRISATVVRAPDIVVERDPAAPNTPEPTVTLHGLVLTGVVAGRVGSLALDSVTLAGQSQDDAGTTETGAIRADAVDLPLAAAILGGARSDVDGVPEPVFASATVETVAAGNAGRDSLTIGALRVGALRARSLPRSFDTVSPLLSRPTASLSPVERQALLSGLADLAGNYAVDHLEVVDLRFRDGATPKTSFGFARVALDGVGGTRDLSLSLEAATLDTPDASLALDRLALWGFDQGNLIGLARRLGGATDDNIPRQTRAAMALTGLAIAVPSKDKTGNDADGNLIRVAVPEVSGAVERTATETVTSTAHLRLVAPLPDHYADPQLATLDALALSRLDVATDYDVAYDRAARRLSLDRFAVAAADLGSVTLGIVLDHVEADPAGLGPNAMSPALAPDVVTLTSASFRFANAGIVEKALPLLARSANVSLPVFKASLKAQAAVTIAQTFGDAPVATELNAAVSTFVDDPRSFSFALSVPGGHTLAALEATAAADLARIVTVTASANR